MEKSCGTCAYFQEIGLQSRNQNPDGQCRLAPPDPTPSIDSHGRWPLVWADDWCGTHHPKDGPALAERVNAAYPDVLPFPGVSRRNGK